MPLADLLLCWNNTRHLEDRRLISLKWKCIFQGPHYKFIYLMALDEVLSKINYYGKTKNTSRDLTICPNPHLNLTPTCMENINNTSPLWFLRTTPTPASPVTMSGTIHIEFQYSIGRRRLLGKKICCCLFSFVWKKGQEGERMERRRSRRRRRGRRRKRSEKGKE